MRIPSSTSPSIAVPKSTPASAPVRRALQTGDSFSSASGAAPMSLGGSATPPTVREGDSNPSVQQLQTLLQGLGYDVGGTDGAFGPHTLAAVEKFQSDQGLTADGVGGPHTWAALSAAAANSSTVTTPPVTTPPVTTPPTSTPPSSGIYGLGSNASTLLQGRSPSCPG